MASGKFVTMMKDIRGLVGESDLDFVRSHAEPLTPRDFVPTSPELSSKYGGRVPPKTANTLTTVLGIAGVILAVCVASVVIYKINKAVKKNE